MLKVPRLNWPASWPATSIDLAEWGPELESQGELFTKLERSLPATIRLERELLMARLKN